MPFKPGQSGNPGGRPVDTVRPLAIAKSKKAFQTLAGLMDSSDENIKLKASIAVLERAFGKPIQEVSGSLEINNKVSLVTPSERLGDNRVSELII